MVALFTTGPANVLKRDCGTLAEGAAGDVTIFDLDSDWTYQVSKSESKSKNSPFDHKKFKGGPVATIVAGKIVWQRS
jgi:dihydroorotase